MSIYGIIQGHINFTKIKGCEMKTKKFKTNINCGSCIETVTPYLNELHGLKEWKVDTTDKNKILEIKGDVGENEVISAVNKAGFKAEPAEESFFKKLLS